MITSSFTQTFENAKGLVSLTVTDSDLSGAKIAVLTRYADNRSDQVKGGSVDTFDKAVQIGYDWFNEQVKSL